MSRKFDRQLKINQKALEIIQDSYTITKKLKHGAKILLFTITSKTRKELADVILKDAAEYQFKK